MPTFEAKEVIQLSILHLLSCGLTQAADTLISESGTGLPCSPVPLAPLAREGRWADVIGHMQRLDGDLVRTLPRGLFLDVKEMAVLELCNAKDFDLARLAARALDDENDDSNGFRGDRRARIDSAFVDAGLDMEPALAKRRVEVAGRLEKAIPTAPADRLTILLSQAIKYQQLTGSLPANDPSEHDNPSLSTVPSFSLITGLPPPQALDNTVVADKPLRSQYGVIKFPKKTHPTSAVFAPTGDSILTGTTDGFVELYDPSTCKLRLDLPYQARDEILLHDSPVRASSISPDASMIATGDDSGAVKIWSLASGKCVRSMQAHPKPVLAVLYTAASDKLITASQDGLIRLHGLRSGKVVQEFRGHTSYVNDVACLGDLIISGSSDNTVRVWRCSSGECLHTVGEFDDRPVVNVLPLSDDSFIAVSRGGPTLIIDKGGSVTAQLEDENGGEFVCACLSFQRHYLYAVMSDKNLLTFNVRSGKVEASVNIGGDGDVEGVTSHPHKNIVATYGSDGSRGKVKLWTAVW